MNFGYDVADCDAHGSKDPKNNDGKNFRPQHRERIVLDLDSGAI